VRTEAMSDSYGSSSDDDAAGPHEQVLENPYNRLHGHQAGIFCQVSSRIAVRRLYSTVHLLTCPPPPPPTHARTALAVPPLRHELRSCTGELG
jgi:hypothetical protein